VLDSQWRGFAFQDALRERSGVDIRVVNDASMAAYGCLTGVGRELVLALGTGFGVALAEDGKLLTIPDYGQRLFDDRHTYDEVAGERARGSDEISWHANVITVVHALAAEWGVQSVHLAGGNSQRLRSSEVATPAFTVTIHGNRAPLLGAVKLFVPVG
jgi:polyphosphate glucokinase